MMVRLLWAQLHCGSRKLSAVFDIVRSGLQSGLDGLPRSSPVRPFGRTA